jgi:hypothetical protein
MRFIINNSEYAAPKGYKFNSEAEVAELITDENIGRVVDPVDYIAEDLFELTHPDRLDDPSAREQYCDEIKDQGISYGRWFHLPWDNSLVRFPEYDEHYALRTFRNRNLVTEEEQQVLRRKKIAVFGLSVGSNVIDNTIQAGIGDGYMLFDPDRLSLANLNRVRAGMGQVGLLKTTVAGRKMAELDPYINQQHFIEGYDRNTDDVLRAEMPDVIIEETDNVEVKARIRRIAGELAIALVTVGDVGDTVVLDVERYDQDGKPFNGKLSEKEFNALLNGDGISDKDKESMLIKMLGLKNLSPRLIDSGMARGIELAGFPQLGTTSAVGGAMASVTIRDVLLDRGIGSGTRVENIRKVIKSKKPTTMTEDVDILKRYIKYRRSHDE